VAGKQPVLATDADPPQGAFGGVVVCALRRHIGSSG
jgi:hypothetical protein